MKRYSFLSKKPREIGEEHGETFRESIRELAEIRLELMIAEPQFKSQSDALELAQRHLPLLENYDPDLYVELMGIASGSRVSAERIVILNHYTDMRDIGACTTVFIPSKTGHLLGQTWDIHASAAPHVVLFNFPAFQIAPILSATGCLGLTGMNQHGLGVCINNLCSLDAQTGLIWPALVRRALRAKTAQEARDLILTAPLGSGHNYALADTRDFFGIESSGTLKKVIQQGSKQAHFHTNHCLDHELARVSTIRKGSTTQKRYETIQAELSKHVPENLEEFLSLLKCVFLEPNPALPHAVATCGTLVMNLTTQQYSALP